MKHTPGPWKISESLHKISIHPRIVGTMRKSNLANARLIAAAPEMLACLEEIIHQLLMDDMSGYGDEQAAAIKAASDLIERLRKGGAR